jgi:hypothetical protein
VILVGSIQGGLYRVSQAGGAPTGLTTLDSSQGEIAHVRPWFLPDGRHFLYTTRNRLPENQAIYLAGLDGSPRKRLVGSKQGGAYAPPTAGAEYGHLLFLRDGTLMAQALDAGRPELAGEPFPVAEQVGSTLSLGYFAVSANGVLAYRSGAVAGTQLTWFDREGKALANLGPPEPYGGASSVALSPDGKRVAVDVTDAQTGNRDIWIFDVASGVPSRFTFDASLQVNPMWSWPDGARLLFASDRGGGILNIYQTDSSRSANEELLLKSGNNLRPWDWSHPGRDLLYGISDPKTGWDFWVLPNPTGAPPERKPVPYLQTPLNQTQGQFSPDGHWVAYTSDESGVGQYQIYVQSFPAGAGKFQISRGAGGTQPRWRRDGKELFFYVSADSKLMSVEVQTAPTFKAGGPRVLFDPRMAAAGVVNLPIRYDIAADGKRFLVNTVANGLESSAAAPITVVTNWLAAVKR